MKVMLRRVVLRFARDRKANIAVIFALTMVPIVFLLGMTLDYTQAVRKREQLNAAADAAAIAAVRPAMLTQTDTNVVKATASAVFAAKANLPGLTATPTPTITVTDSGLARSITVSYTAQSVNNFPSVLGKQTWQVAGSATAKASSAPNMNFYLLLDDSPSMAIAATQNDITNMIAFTKNQPSYAKNCGFACHETRPNNAAPSSTNKDNLTVARANNITLRIDLVTNAVTQLLKGPWTCPQAGVTGGVMQCMSALNNTTYKAAIYTFDYALNTIQVLTTPDSAATKINNIQLLTVDHQNCPIVDSKGNCTYTTDVRHGYLEGADGRQRRDAAAGHRHQSGGRYAAGGGLPRHRRRRGQAHPEVGGHLRRQCHLCASGGQLDDLAMPATARHGDLHDDQESRHSHCGPLHRVSAAADRKLVQHPHRAVQQPDLVDRHDCDTAAIVRVARPVCERADRWRHFRGADQPLHQGCVQHGQPRAVGKGHDPTGHDNEKTPQPLRRLRRR
ncbi:Flp pilus assembly protein TadG [Bradyrhizobium japonicum]